MAKKETLPTLTKVGSLASALASKHAQPVPDEAGNPAPAAGSKKRCKVELAHWVPWEGEATSDEDAVAQMCAEHGLRKTECDHQFHVVWLDA